MRGSWRSNRTEIFWPPTLMAINVVSFSFSWCSTGGPRVHSAGCWLSLLHYQHLLWTPNSIGVPKGPFGQVWLSLPHLIYNSFSNCLQLAIWLLSWLSYIIVQRPLDLWNRMFNRHQAEITVMQFRGHSLQVRQSMRVSWDFLACPILLANFRHTISSPNCHWNVSLPSGASPWMAFWAESKVKI